MGVSVRTAYKWLARYRQEGRRGLENRSSRPHWCPHQIDETQRQRIIKARYKRRIYRQISQESGISVSTIARLLRREGLNRLAALEPAPPPKRYEREAPGAPGYQEARALRQARTSRHWRSPERPLSRRRLGLRSCRHRRPQSRGLGEHQTG